MRVTMLVRCLAMMRGGGETRHLAWARELAALGATVDIIAGRPLLFGGPRFGGDEPVPVTLLRSPYTRDFVYRRQRQRGFGRITMQVLHLDEEWFVRAAWRHIESSPTAPDVVHAHALYQTARLRRRAIPVVINVPGEPHHRYIDDLKQADAVIADGWAAAHLPALFGLQVTPVVKGVDVDRFSPSGPSRRAALRLEHARVVLVVARLVPIKNVALVLDAAARLKARMPEVHVVIVGDGPERDPLRARAHALDLGEAVSFIGMIPHATTAELYRSADVLAVPSTFDNSPNVVLEAMACGLPIVATDSGGAQEFVEDSAAGTIVPVGDVAAFADALESWLRDPARRRAAGARNRARVVADYSWRASAEQVLDVYHRVVAERHPPAAANA